MPEPILTAQGWVPSAGPDRFSAQNPRTGRPLPASYPVSSGEELLGMAEAARKAARELPHPDPGCVASFLQGLSDRLDADRDPIARVADEETALGIEPRLRTSEMDRTVDQLRQAAACVLDGWWRMAAIEPDLNIRSMLEHLGGAVLTIGPANFPLAYNASCGGDFTAAIAAGNPVIAKGHPAHPGTSRRLAEHAHDARVQAGLPDGWFQFFHDCKPDDGIALIEHPGIAAVGFTGSRKTGLALKKVADARGKPAHMEMSSINPIFVLPGALAERGGAIADEIADSMLAAAGQQCTSPGLLVLQRGPGADAFCDRLRERLANAEPAVMLGGTGVDHIERAMKTLLEGGAEVLLGGHRVPGDAARFAPTLLRVTGAGFLSNPEPLQTEAFGVSALIVECDDAGQMVRVAGVLDGNLTGSVYTGNSAGDDTLYAQVVAELRPRVGRLLNDAVTTGVAVRPAMVHGGPFPATGSPGSTAVGVPVSILRFTARRCYDRVRPERLPPELRDRNPTGAMWRLIAGRWTTDDAHPQK